MLLHYGETIHSIHFLVDPYYQALVYLMIWLFDCQILFVLVAPTISSEVTGQRLNNGDTATYNCIASGEPIPTINWYFDGILVDKTNVVKYSISQSINASTITISSTLKVMNVESSDVGAYICNATNAVSSDNSSGVLVINGE